MTEEILKRIDVLAAKLNTTGEHIWSILLRQARIEAIEWLCWAIFWAGVCGLCVKGIRWCHKSEDSMWNDGFPMTVLGFVGVLTFIFAIGCLSSVSTPFFNPEYWALKQLGDVLGKK